MHELTCHLHGFLAVITVFNIFNQYVQFLHINACFIDIFLELSEIPYILSFVYSHEFSKIQYYQY